MSSERKQDVGNQSIRIKIHSLMKKHGNTRLQNDSIFQLIVYEILGLLVMCLIAFSLSVVFDRIILYNLYKISFYIFSETNNTFIRYLEHVTVFSWPRIYFFFLCFAFAANILYWGQIVVYRFRYLYATGLLILLVIGKFSGSSLGFYDALLLDNTDSYEKSTLLGNPQGIRGDEWATEKPYYFAQESVDYSYYNRNLMYDGCDMVVSAFAPTKNIIILARPDLWGFLFLPRDYAFSYYWNIRLILLFMASFELGHMLTKSKKYGVIWALFVSLSPPIQWWLSQVLMIIVWSGEYFIVAFYKLITSTKWKQKLIWCLLATWLGIIYVLTMYPATQVPMAYIFAALVVYVIIVNWNIKPFDIKNVLSYGLVILLIVIFLLYYLHMSGMAMITLLDTHYPGKSRNWLELRWDYELLQLINPITWLKPLETINNCEASQYYSFMPFIIVAICLNINVIKKNRKQTFILICSLMSVCFFMWQMAYLPQIKLLNKITLLSYSYPVRILMAADFGFMLILLLVLHYNETMNGGKSFSWLNIFISYILYAIVYLFALKSELLKEYLPENRYFILFIFAAVYAYMGFCLISGNAKLTKTFITLYIIISFFSTAFINPITYGTDSMFEKATMKKIREINDADPGRWMVSGHTTISNLVTAQGVARVTGTYYYPDIKMWRIIDPQNEYENMWNQYAHIDMRLTDGETRISQYDYEQGYELHGVDKLVYVNLETAKELNIKYIFTKFKVPDTYIEKNYLTKLYTNNIDGWDIYIIN